MKSPSWLVLSFSLALIFTLPSCSKTKDNSSESASPTRDGASAVRSTFIIPDDDPGGGGGPPPVCGNGVIEGAELCDGGTCCQRNCQKIPAAWSVVCDPLLGTLCNGSSGDCSTNQLAVTYPGTQHYDVARGVTP